MSVVPPPEARPEFLEAVLLVMLDLAVKHRRAALAGDKAERERLFGLQLDLDREYPAAAAELERRYIYT